MLAMNNRYDMWFEITVLTKYDILDVDFIIKTFMFMLLFNKIDDFLKVMFYFLRELPTFRRYP